MALVLLQKAIMWVIINDFNLKKMITSLSERKSYSCLEKYTYLNQASLGLISNTSTEKMTQFLNRKARFGNIHISDDYFSILAIIY